MDNQKLSERVEALEGPDREVDASILAFDPNFTANLNEELGFVQYWTKHKTWLAAGQAPNYTASIDAAMSLVPEGRGWIAGWGQVLPDEPMGGAHITAHSVFAGYDVANDVIAEGEAATPALALCAAALKARGL